MDPRKEENSPFLEIHTLSHPPVRLSLNSISKFMEVMKDRINQIKDQTGDPGISKKTKVSVTFLTHGYMSWIANPEEHFYDIKNAIINSDERQIVVMLDWSSMSEVLFRYRFAVRNVRKLSQVLKDHLVQLRHEYEDKIFIHGIGFSLGSHLMGNVAELADNVLKEKGYQVPFTFDRISGLDPAGPIVIYKPWPICLFQHETTPLGRRHAKMVDIIHTTDCLGTDQPLGHVDFYVNWGKSPRGFPNLGYANKAGHIHCLKLFLDSIVTPNAFETRWEIASVPEQTRKHLGDKRVAMGYFCEEDVTGLYYVD